MVFFNLFLGSLDADSTNALEIPPRAIMIKAFMLKYDDRKDFIFIKIIIAAKAIAKFPNLL